MASRTITLSSAEADHLVQALDVLIGEMSDKIETIQRSVKPITIALDKEFRKTCSSHINENNTGREKKAISTGFVRIDNTLSGGGIQQGQMIVVAGRPSMGKTALATQFAYNAAVAGKKVVMCSFEMSVEQMTDRFICMGG